MKTQIKTIIESQIIKRYGKLLEYKYDRCGIGNTITGTNSFSVTANIVSGTNNTIENSINNIVNGNINTIENSGHSIVSGGNVNSGDNYTIVILSTKEEFTIFKDEMELLIKALNRKSKLERVK